MIVAVDPVDGEEGVVATATDFGMMPLMAADDRRRAIIIAKARQMARMGLLPRGAKVMHFVLESEEPL